MIESCGNKVTNTGRVIAIFAAFVILPISDNGEKPGAISTPSVPEGINHVLDQIVEARALIFDRSRHHPQEVMEMSFIKGEALVHPKAIAKGCYQSFLGAGAE